MKSLPRVTRAHSYIKLLHELADYEKANSQLKVCRLDSNRASANPARCQAIAPNIHLFLVLQARVAEMEKVCVDVVVCCVICS